MKRVTCLVAMVLIVGCGGGSGSGGAGSIVTPIHQLDAFSPSGIVLPGNDSQIVDIDACVSNTQNFNIKSYRVEAGQADGTFTTPRKVWEWSGTDTQFVDISRNIRQEQCANIADTAGNWRAVKGETLPYRIFLNGQLVGGVSTFTVN